MAWPKRLVLVRHAESEGNVLSKEERARYDRATHAYQLTERGRKQARITGQFLKATFGEFDVYYVSYYERSKETMNIMFPDARIREDPRLAEAQRGIWQTMTDEQVRTRFPEEFDRREREGLYHYRPFGGENWPDIELRIHSFLGTLSRDCCGQSVLMVVHGHWLILLQRLLHHFPTEEAVARYMGGTFANASVTVYAGDQEKEPSRLVLLSENQIPWEGKL